MMEMVRGCRDGGELCGGGGRVGWWCLGAEVGCVTTHVLVSDLSHSGELQGVIPRAWIEV